MVKLEIKELKSADGVSTHHRGFALSADNREIRKVIKMSESKKWTTEDKIKALQEIRKDLMNCGGCRGSRDSWYVLDEIISDLEKSKATWVGTPHTIEVDETDEARIFETRMFYSCSSCGAEFGQYKPSDAYCKFCGAKMEETDLE